MVPTPKAALGNRFVDLERLAEGGEGGTWRARDPQAGRWVVLKHVDGGPRMARAFVVLRRISSPHLPAALELLLDESGAWLVTAHVEGEALEAGPVPLAQALLETLGVARALAAIHQIGTHHGDVSPNNVLVTQTRGVVLTDLGHVGALGTGTPGFIAPEVLAGGGGAAADFFALGCVLCFRLFGRSPWRDPAKVAGLGSLTDVRKRLSALAEAADVELPEPVGVLLERLLDPDPRSRVSDAETIVARLKQLADARASGQDLRARVHWWTPRRFGYVGRNLDEFVARLREPAPERPKVVFVSGPTGSGRRRVVEEIVASLQEVGSPASLSDPDRLAAALGGEDWVEAWLSGRVDALLGLPDGVTWPERLHDPAVRGAVLRAAPSLARATLVLPVEPEELAAMQVDGDGRLLSIELQPLSRDESIALVSTVLEGDDPEPFGTVLHRVCGGWPARIVRAIEAMSRVGVETADPSAIEEALRTCGPGDVLAPDLARNVLEAVWGGEVTLPRSLVADDGMPLAAVHAAARAALGDVASVLARSLLADRMAKGDSVGYALAIDAGDGAALELALSGEGLLPERVIRFFDEATENGSEALRLRAARQLMRRGESERARVVLSVESCRSTPSRRETARALQRLGRPSEALEVIAALPAADQCDPDSLGIRFRSLVDLGHARQALEEARRWADEMDRTREADASALLWAGLAAIHVGAEADGSRFLDAAAACVSGREGADAAGVHARVHQLRANLLQARGDIDSALGELRCAAGCFSAAGEPIGKLLVEASLSSLLLPAGELEEALSRGRSSLRGLVALAQIQVLAAACSNLVQALVLVGGFDEGERMVELVDRMCGAAGAGELAAARLSRASAELVAARPRAEKGWRAEIESAMRGAAKRLEAAGAEREAADAWLQAAVFARADGRRSDADRLLAHARRTAGIEPGLDLQVAIAIEALAQATEPGLHAEASRSLARLPAPPALIARGQRLLAWNYDRTFLIALRRQYPAGHAACRTIAQRLLQNLEFLMSKAPQLDGKAVRRQLLTEAADPSPLRALLGELEHDADAMSDSPTASVPSTDSLPLSHDDARWARLVRVFRRLSREDGLERVLEQVVEAMMELTEAERGIVVVLDIDGRRVEVARELSPRTKAVQVSRSIIEQVLSEGESLLSVDAVSDDRFDHSRSISHLNLRSVVAVPLVFRGEVLGAAYVDHRLRRGAFDQSDLSLMEDFAGLAALAVAHARALGEIRATADELGEKQRELNALLDAREKEVHGLREEVRRTAGRSSYRGMIGTSTAMQGVFKLVDRLADSNVPVVIHGESGTGKELVARAIHDAGLRSSRAFVAENCAAIPETLLESVLFGHAKGAFTGASTAHPGLFEAADGGTIFLDEIGEMSPGMQTKLLRVLQEGEVRRVGENVPRPVDVRVVAASNRDLEGMVEAGTFRQDLYYRIHVVSINLPPLRDRREDIAPLVAHFLRNFGSELDVMATAMRKLMRYPWPGNVRELENEVQRWVALAEQRVTPEDLSPAIAVADESTDPDDLRLRPRVDSLERELIARALERTEGNQTQAASLLGLSRYGLQKKLRRLDGEET